MLTPDLSPDTLFTLRPTPGGAGAADGGPAAADHGALRRGTSRLIEEDHLRVDVYYLPTRSRVAADLDLPSGGRVLGGGRAQQGSAAAGVARTTFTRALSIGAVDGPEDAEAGRVSSAFMRGHRVVMANGRVPEIWWHDLDGRPMRRIGRRGRSRDRVIPRPGPVQGEQNRAVDAFRRDAIRIGSGIRDDLFSRPPSPRSSA